MKIAATGMLAFPNAPPFPAQYLHAMIASRSFQHTVQSPQHLSVIDLLTRTGNFSLPLYIKGYADERGGAVRLSGEWHDSLGPKYFGSS